MGPLNKANGKSRQAGWRFWGTPAAVVTCSIVICGLVGWLAVLEATTFSRTIIKDRQEQLRLIGYGQARVLEDTFRSATSQLQVHAQSAKVIAMAKGAIYDSQIPAGQPMPTRAMFDQLGWLADSVYRLDATGTVLARQPFRMNREGTDFSSKPGVAEVLRTKRPVISRLFETTSGRSAITACVPVFDAGQLVGVLRALTYLDHLKQAVQPYTEATALDFLWIDDNGTILQHPNIARIGEDARVCEHACCQDQRQCLAAVIDQVLTGNGPRGFLCESCSPTGEAQILAVVPLTLGTRQTYALMAKSKAPIMAPILQHRRRMIIAALILGGVVMVSMFSMLRRLSRDSATREAHRVLEQTVELRTWELEVARKKAEQANCAKSEFLASMSHEIRTPLNAVIGFSQILHRTLHDESQKQYTKSIQIAGNNLMVLINDILDLSKAQAGMMTIKPEPMALRHLVDEIWRLYGLQASQKGLDFDLRIAPDVPEMLVLDEARIRQVLVNLIGNALKFTAEGFVRLSVSVEQRDADDAVDLFLTVKDTGMGISSEDQKMVFDVFRQAGDAEEKPHEGTGLGLSITKKLVDIMNGRISVVSDLNKGSTFTVLLREVEVCRAQKPVFAQRLLAADEVEFEPCLVLIADDDPASREVFSQMLRLANLEVCEAADGKATVELARARHPSLIIMDLLMPTQDGFTAAEELKADCETMGIPLIALSAYPVSDFERRDTTTFSAYLQKPIPSEILYRELAEYLPIKKTLSSTELENNLFAEDTTECHPVLMKHLQQQIAPRVMDMQGALKIRDILEIGQQIHTLGRSSDSAFWTELGERLFDFANHFDKRGIDSSLKDVVDALIRNDLISDLPSKKWSHASTTEPKNVV
ncbi:hypothetical protein BVY04_01565 [bacterium M21]|nr:hypothetical protein BVY04_01565 [bacterium M21]